MITKKKQKTTKPKKQKADLVDMDDLYAQRIAENCHTDDFENNHQQADEVLCRALIFAGMKKTVKTWRKVQRYYA